MRNWTLYTPAWLKHDCDGKPWSDTAAVGTCTTLARSRWLVARDTIRSFCVIVAELEMEAAAVTMLDSYGIVRPTGSSIATFWSTCM